jgi:hypothetical protein
MNANFVYEQMEWRVAIPSYKRARVLCDRTLALLRRHAIPPEKIHIFVANEQEEQEYLQMLPPEACHIHVAEVGMAAVRNAITAHFPVGARLFCLDDDVKDLVELRKGKLEPIQDLAAFIEAGFEEAARRGVRLWGVYPVNNAYFMREAHTTHLTYIVGCAWGIVNPGPILQCTVDDKEDFQRSLCMYLLDGGVLRLNHVAPVTNYWTTPGGMQVARTKEGIARATQAFVGAYTGLAKLRTKAHGDDIRLWDSRTDKVFGPEALAAYTPPKL